jgi:HSP20 family protein
MGQRVSEWFAPASEASTTGDAYTITIELPGVADGDIDVSVHDGTLTVKGEKKTSREETGETWYFSERQYGAFTRSFRLPPDADEDAVAADLKDGVLTVRLPKKVETEKRAKSVAVKRG